MPKVSETIRLCWTDDSPGRPATEETRSDACSVLYLYVCVLFSFLVFTDASL